MNLPLRFRIQQETSRGGRIPYLKTLYWMAGIAAVVCAFLFRPSVLRAQGAAGAFKVMRELGFPNVLHLADGITKWKEAGFPTAR